MKKLLFYWGTAGFTFILSLNGVYAFGFLIQFPKAEVPEVSEDVFCPLGAAFLENKIQIEYEYTLATEKSFQGFFIVTNTTGKPVYYLSSNKDRHFENWIGQAAKTQKSMKSMLCNIDTTEQKLEPFETVTLEVPVPQNRKPFKIGFDFKVEGKLKSKTTWLEVEKQAVFVGKAAR